MLTTFAQRVWQSKQRSERICMNAGRRAVELACGMMFQWLEDLVRFYVDGGLAAVMSTAGLTQDEITNLAKTFNEAMSKLKLEISHRLAPWRRIPLLLLGLLADSEELALELARKANHQYNEDCDSGQFVHRVSWFLMDAATKYGKMFRLFVTGICRRGDERVRAFFDLLAGYAKGWTAGDRIEAPHKLLGDTFRRAPAATLATASSELRWNHFASSVQLPSMIMMLEELCLGFLNF